MFNAQHNFCTDRNFEVWSTYLMRLVCDLHLNVDNVHTATRAVSGACGHICSQMKVSCAPIIKSLRILYSAANNALDDLGFNIFSNIHMIPLYLNF